MINIELTKKFFQVFPSQTFWPIQYFVPNSIVNIHLCVHRGAFSLLTEEFFKLHLNHTVMLIIPPVY